MKKTISFIIGFSIWAIFCSTGFAQDPIYYPGIRSQKILAQAKKNHPDNPVISYYLGWAYFKNGNQEAASDEWDNYLKKYPDNDWAHIIHEQLTLAEVNRSDTYARNIAKQDPTDLAIKINPNKVVVFNFQDRSYAGFSGLSKGLTDLIIHDLSKIQQLTTVSRIQMQAVLNETQFSEFNIVQSEPSAVEIGTANRIGRLLLSGHTVWGEFTDMSKTELNITVHMTETVHGTEIAGFNFSGHVEDIGMIEKNIVFEILKALNIHKEDIEPNVFKSINRSSFTNFNAFMIYSNGLEFFDKRRFRLAKEAFKNAAQIDDKFHLARNAASATPKDTLLSISIEPESFILETESQHFIKTQNLPYTFIDETKDQMVLDVMNWINIVTEP